MKTWRCVTCGRVTTDPRYIAFGHNHPGTIIPCCVPYWIEETGDNPPETQLEPQEIRLPRGGYF